MASQVLEGTWEEIAEQGLRLAGRRVRLIVLDGETAGAAPAIGPAGGRRGEEDAGGAVQTRLSICGKYAGSIPSTDEFLKEKRREAAL